MKYFIYCITVIVLAGLNFGLFGYLKVFGVAPDLLLLFVVGASLQRDADDSFYIAFLGGLFMDFYNGLLAGSFTIAFLLVSLLSYLFIHKLVVFELSWRYLFAATILSTVFTALFVWFVTAAVFHAGWMQNSIDIRLLRSHLLIEIVYNSLLAYPIYILASWLKNFILSLQGKAHRII